MPLTELTRLSRATPAHLRVPYLVLGLGTGQAVDLALPPGRDELIAYGPLLSDDGADRLGTAALVRAPGPEAARSVLTADRYACVEVHDWRFGGRPT